jgi:dTDP-glucose 4,6-dehydratase/UDP-glucuronate decarboxylase
MDIIRQDAKEVVAALGESVQQLEGRTILMAGGAGFLPAYIIDVLAWANREHFAEPCRVIAVDNFVSGAPQRLSHLTGEPWFRLVQADLTRPLTLNEPVQFILHGASIASPTFYRRFPFQTIEVNVQGTKHLLDLAMEAKSAGFLYLSSSEIYGDPPATEIPTREEYRGNVSCTGPRACYDESKRLAETLCFEYFRHHQVPVKIARPFNVYGPGLRLDDGRIIPDILHNGLQGRPLTLLSDGLDTRSFCYAADAAAALLLLLVSSSVGEAFNVGNDAEISMAAVAGVANELFDPKPGVKYATSPDPNYRVDSPRRRCPDLAKIHSHLGWRPQIGLTEGLKRTIAWYQMRRGV